MKIKSFDPIVCSCSEILILGTMPGNESLRQQQYYAHSQNRFWQIIYRTFENDMKLDYKERVEFLRERKIALWDMYRHCEREGSLDSNIRNAETNDIIAFLEEYPHIKYVFCNGGRAYDLFKRTVLPKVKRPIPYMNLPSTSPANASIPMDVKLRKWSQIRFALENKVIFESLLDTKHGTIAVYSNCSKVSYVCLPGDERPNLDECALFEGDALTEKARNEIREYLQGKRKVFDIPVFVTGTPFQKRIYEELLKIPYGHTVSYGGLAEMAGNKGAARAVGHAMRKNPVPLIVPCHRVIGSNGKNIGFMGIRNNPMQETLLSLEQKYS